MSLTGAEDGPPCAPEGPVVGRLQAAARALAAATAARGHPVALDVGAELSGRAAARSLHRRGRVSAGGACRLMEARDGWVAVNLGRPEDAGLVPAVTGHAPSDDPWADLAAAARSADAAALVAQAQLVGIPAAALPPRREEPAPGDPAAPFRVTGMGRPGGTARRPVVVDFSAMWAGPLCAHVLGRAGCRVIKVEDPARPDGSRVGDRALFERLHAGHELAAVHFGSAAGRRALDALLDEADVVVEASRPRALGNLGLSPEAFLAGRPGRTWVSITGYGRSGPWSDRVAFGDDAAVAGGLVAWDADGRPVFCADAVADPISGMYAALAAVLSLNAGGGHLIDVAMRDAAAFVASGQTCPGRHRVTRRPDGGWMAHHDGLSAPVAPPARLSAP